MSDILDRIRSVETTPLHGTEAWVNLWETLQDARAEIERLREAIRRLAEQDATLSACEGAVTVTMDATLTDAERTLIEKLTWESEHPRMGRLLFVMPHDRETARGLLERTK